MQTAKDGGSATQDISLTSLYRLRPMHTLDGMMGR